MKGFSEIRGHMFRMSYDPIRGEFLNIAVTPSIVETVSVAVSQHKKTQYLKPKIISRSKPQTRPTTLQSLRKKQA